MAITVEIPPETAKEANDYVVRCGTTIEQLLFDRLKVELQRDREAKDGYSYLMSQSGWLPNDYTFNRDEANYTEWQKGLFPGETVRSLGKKVMEFEPTIQGV